MEKENKEAIYDKIATGYEKATTRPMRRFAYDYTIKHYIGDLKNKKVLDLACGEGVSSRLMQELGAKLVHGIDVSQEMINLANKNNLTNIVYEQGDCMSPDLLVRDKFDVVSGMMLIHYAESKEQISILLKNIYSALNPKGVFYGMIVNPELQMNGYEKYGIKITPTANIEGSKSLIELHDFDWNKFCEFSDYSWSIETYEKIFKKEGFKVEWLPGVVSDEGINNYGENFWDDYLNNPVYIFIKATKI